MVWKLTDPECGESHKIIWELVPYTRGRGVDLGCGPAKTFPHFIGVDNCKDVALFDSIINPDLKVDDCAKLDLLGSASMDFVFSSHLLEHIENYKGALKEWWRLVRPGGYLILYLPHKDFYPNVGEHGANPDHVHDFLPGTIEAAMKDVGCWDLVRNEDRNGGREYSFFQVYKKRSNKYVYSYKTPKAVKTAAVVRYGAIGDLIQASSVIHALKDEGYHVTLYTTPNGEHVVKHDPNIDAMYVQDADQVPNHMLPDFWEWESKKFDKFVNLSESVEGTLLALPGRTNGTWPINLRRKYMNTNYLEFMHDLAGVDAPIRQKFYPSQEEKSWAVKERKKIGGDFVFMYCLAGSSVHKVWPYMDTLFARIFMSYPDARIVTMGDVTSKLLEQGWENESRVIRGSGVYSVRETLSLLDQVDFVIGPETGVINAAGTMDMPKLCFLSHSSEENLTKHWKNTIALAPKNTSCYPCHVMHYGWSKCNQDMETGTAACQADISVDVAWNALKTLMKE